MSSRQLDEEAIFHVARDLANPDVRSTYLAQVCAGDQALRERVEALLVIHEQEHSFLASEPAASAPTEDHTPLTERPGVTIGRYKLMEQVGEGGMGVVFVAEQERPIRRKVALKIIKAGMDTKEVVARFSAERQALALMDHPHIAKVFDAGGTDSGRPYFVMELVRGIPITDYCDKKKLTVQQRLELLIMTCHAIQHAHQKGIIHRDIKPSNVLVTEHDGKPVPKVIDFGVAKATNQRLAEQTIYTRFQQIIGTPMYMSPEQAELSGLDVDTRSDVYSLGVLLYELITGVPPFEEGLFARASYDEIRRIICEQEPATPSIRLTSLGDSATTISRDRATDPERLLREVKGDLDWIVLKAMEKDRTRRYESASRFADDVERFLNDSVVEARPPSLGYKMNKFVRRNRLLVTTVAVVFMALIIGLGSAIFGLRKAQVEARKAQNAARKAEIASHESQLASRKSQIAEAVAKASLATLADVVYHEALSSALAGDAERTEQLLEIGRSANLPLVRRNLVRASLAYFNGDADAAIDLLNQIADDNQSNVAVFGLLSAAHGAAAHDSESLRYLEMANGLKAKAAEDLLFQGFAQTDPSVGLPLVEAAMEKRPSPGALAIRARERFWAAVQRRDPGQASHALADTQAAQLLLGKKPGLLTTEMDCHHLIAKHGDSSERPAHERRARAVAMTILKSGDKLGNWWTAMYFADADEPELALDAWGRVDLRDRVLSQYIAALLHRTHDDAEEALRQFDEMIPDATNLYAMMSRAWLLAEIKAQRGDLERLVQQIETLAGNSPQQNYLTLSMYFLLGDRQRQREAAERLLENGGAAYEHWGMKHALDFLAGECSERRIQEAEQAVEGRMFDECVLRKAIGERLLLLGRREEAKEQFEKCIATGTWQFFEYNWCKAYLVQMEKDSSWPHWLPPEASMKPDPIE
jgi:serine/threonine protein kinase